MARKPRNPWKMPERDEPIPYRPEELMAHLRVRRRVWLLVPLAFAVGIGLGLLLIWLGW